MFLLPNKSMFLVPVEKLNEHSNTNYSAYFTNGTFVGTFIFLIICTFLLIRYFFKRKVSIAVISLIKKYSEYDEVYTYYLTDVNEKKYHVCEDIYNLLKGNEVIEVLLEDDDNILQLLKIRKQEGGGGEEKRNT